jgi:hypothetical protein
VSALNLPSAWRGEFQVSLLAPLPLRDVLEGVDVPANELGEHGCTMIDARERAWVHHD